MVASSPLPLRLGCIVTLIALWVGLMIATAGIALHPPVARIATPLLCADEVEFRSRGASYRPGEYIVTREVLCTAADGKTVDDITFKAAALTFLLYSAIAWLVLRFLLIPFVSRRATDTIEAAKLRFSTGQPEGDSPDVQSILDRVQDAVAPGQARVVVRNVTLGDAPEDDPAERLVRLKQLHEQGLITTADYEAKKAEILSGL